MTNSLFFRLCLQNFIYEFMFLRVCQLSTLQLFQDIVVNLHVTMQLASLNTYNIDIFGCLGVRDILSVDYAISCLLFYLDTIVGIVILLFLCSCSLKVI